MLATLGVITILCLLAAVMSKRLSPLVALIALPIIAALLGGFGLQTSAFIITGIKNVAPVVGMFVFAILFFGIMTDAGMLDPIIDRILRTVGTRPTRIVVGTATLALLVHLDGSGERPVTGDPLLADGRPVGRLGTVVDHVDLGPIALALCGASDPETQKTIDALLAEHGAANFAARFLTNAGHAWAASLLADFPDPSVPEGEAQ